MAGLKKVSGIGEAKPCLPLDIRSVLVGEAKANLRPGQMEEFLRLLDGDYRNDEEALRGFIWNATEEQSDV